jgi:hypothetical protein
MTTLSAAYEHLLPWTIGSLFLLLSKKVNLCRTSAIATCAQFKGTVARDVFLIILSYLQYDTIYVRMEILFLFFGLKLAELCAYDTIGI